MFYLPFWILAPASLVILVAFFAVFQDHHSPGYGSCQSLVNIRADALRNIFLAFSTPHLLFLFLLLKNFKKTMLLSYSKSFSTSLSVYFSSCSDAPQIYIVIKNIHTERTPIYSWSKKTFLCYLFHLFIHPLCLL